MSSFTGAEFPSTHWSVVAEAGDPDSAARGEALDGLARRYNKPLRAFVCRRLHVSPDKADDLVQEFFLKKFLKERLLESADRNRGRFRFFLLGAMRNFLADEARFAARPVRAAGLDAVGIDTLAEPADSKSDPELLFEADCARQIIQEALDLMRHDLGGDGSDLWQVFQSRILEPLFHAREPESHDELADRLGLESPDQSSNRLITAKRAFYRSLRSVLREYAGREPNLEEEIADLRSALCKVR